MRFLVVSLLFAMPLAGQATIKSGPSSTESRKEAEPQFISRLRAKASSGDAYSQFQLGIAYQDGKDISKDCAEAVKWFRKAADQGSGHGFLSLGLMYHIGDCVPQDYAEAYVWYSLAATAKMLIAKDYRDEVAKKLTRASLERAQARAKKIYEEVQVRKLKS